MDKGAKEALVTDYAGIFTNAGVVVVAHYSGLSVSQMDDLRHQMAEVGGTVKVTKNRLVKRALAGTSAEGISTLFVGPTAIAYSADPIAAPKIADKFANENDRLVILGGIMEQTVLDAAGVKNLASLPSLDELRGRIVGLLNAPATKLVGLLQAPAGQLVRIMAGKATHDDVA